MQVHAIQAGWLAGNETTLRGKGWSSLLRRRQNVEWPAYVYIVEHPEGHIAIDTGMNARGWATPGLTRRFLPSAVIGSPEEEVGPQMRAKGLRPEDVRKVVLTHLDPDHVGGIEHFPQAEFLVHRPEYEFATTTFMGKLRYQPKSWPAAFAPTLYDLDPAPYGPFPESKAVTERGDIRLVPIPGHTVAQVGAILKIDGVALFFSADHVLRQDWFVEDYKAGNLLGLGSLGFPKRAIETSRRIHRFVEEMPTVLLPAHDDQAPARLAGMEPLEV